MESLTVDKALRILVEGKQVYKGGNHIVLCFEGLHYIYIVKWNKLEYQSKCWCNK